MAKDDRDRAEASDSDRMRFQLACSAEAWSARAELLERLETNRAHLESQMPASAKNSHDDDDETGANQ